MASYLRIMGQCVCNTLLVLRKFLAEKRMTILNGGRDEKQWWT